MSNVNRRQFIIMKTAYEANEYKSIKLKDGFYLSYHQDLEVMNSGETILLGNAFHTNKRGSITLDGNELFDMSKWGGRWVLICDSKVYMDASGTLGVFYGYDDNGDIVCSSSLALALRVIPDAHWCSDYLVDRNNPKWFDYYPGPYTPISNIKALLPSQYIDLTNGAIIIRTDYDFSRYDNYKREELEDMVIEAAGTLLQNVSDKYSDNIWLPLTGGVDSRTIFAFLKGRGISFNSYTIKRPDTMPYDYLIPIKICKKGRVRHILYKTRKTTSRDDLQIKIGEILEHCGGKTTGGTEIGQYLNSIDVPEAKKSIVLWGTVWRIGGGLYTRFLDDADPDSMTIDQVVACLRKMGNGEWQKSNIHVRSLEEWTEYIIENKVRGLNWNERIHWEQRTGAWAKYSYQLFDMFDSVRISPINCQMLLEMMVALYRNYPNSHIPQHNMIKKCCPEISNIPYGIYDRSLVAKRCHKIISAIKSFYAQKGQWEQYNGS